MTTEPAVHLRQCGSYDADFEVAVSPGGVWTIEGGTYVTRGRTSRRLTRSERATLARLVAAVSATGTTLCEAGSAFETTLRVGCQTWQWVGPAEEASLAALVRWLSTRPRR